MRNQIINLATRSAYRAGDAFLSALVFDNIFGFGLPEWKVAAIAAASAAIKPVQMFFRDKVASFG